MFNKLAWILCIFLFLSFVSSAAYQSSQFPQIKTNPPFNHPKVDVDYGKIPLYFIPNEGQVEEKALCYADTAKYSLWITREGLVFDSIKSAAGATHRYERDVSRVRFLDSDRNVQVFP
jgi:hypothetical protein